jgi:DNA-binding transcriptional LysR family regulator
MANFRIKAFLTVATRLNFSRAAKELLLMQPAVMQPIKSIEDQLGTPLFDRTAGPITVTPAGQALSTSARKPKAHSEEAHTVVAKVSGNLKSPVSTCWTRVNGLAQT